jgi:transcriptional regulator
MYTPSHFAEADLARIGELIRQYGFATLISAGADGLQVTHAPIQFDRTRGAHGTLVGHMARANPHAGALVDGASVLVMFHGPHGYISPTWYRDENPRVPNVPTWNYAVVHVHGRLRRIDDDAQKWKIVTELAAQYEQDSAAPWNPGELAAHAGKLGAIVGFEVDIERIEAKSKLSQNRSVADQKNVIARLEAGSHPDSHAMARLMRENLARKKPG